MSKCCENCALYNPKNSKEGYCEYWRQIVEETDYCVEYK